MSLLFYDGCDHYDSRAELANKWTHEDIASVDTTGGRFGGGALLLAPIFDEVYQDITEITEVFAGVQFKIPTFPSGQEEIILFQNSTSSQIVIQITGSGGVRVLRSSTEIDVSDSGIIKLDFWHTIEARVVHHDSTGVVQVKIDGVMVIDFSGDTIPASATGIDRVEFRAPSFTGNATLDDFYIMDSNGASPVNTFLNDWKIDTVFPDGDGNYTQFGTTNPASPTTHWDKVEEPAVDDTSYNETATANDKDTFTLAALPAITAQTIFSVQQVSRAESSSVGSSNFQNMFRISASDFNGGTHATVLNTLEYYLDVSDLNPNTSAAWTESIINGLESGVEHISSNTTRVTQHCLEVLRQNTAPLLRVSQFHVQVLRQADAPDLRVSQFQVQVMRSNLAPPFARASQLSLEVARLQPPAEARLTQIILETARRSRPTAQPGLQSWMVWDTVNTFVVRMVAGEAPTSSPDDITVLNGANVGILGNEIFQWVTATDLGDGVYSLSRLLRGRLGTELFMNSHSIGETFVILDEDSVRRVVQATTDLNVQRFFKIVGAGQPAFSAPIQPVINTGASQKPWKPCQIAATRNVNDITFTWIRRTRIDYEWRDFVDVPLGEGDERYEVDILNGGGGVVRTIEVTAETATYLGTEQETDFGGGNFQNPVAVKIYQLSNIAGRGHPASAIV